MGEYDNVSATDLKQLRQLAADLVAAKADLHGLTDALPQSGVESRAAEVSNTAYNGFHQSVIGAVNIVSPTFDREAQVIERWCATVEAEQQKAKRAIEALTPDGTVKSKPEQPAKPQNIEPVTPPQVVPSKPEPPAKPGLLRV